MVATHHFKFLIKTCDYKEIFRISLLILKNRLPNYTIFPELLFLQVPRCLFDNALGRIWIMSEHKRTCVESDISVGK